MAGIRQEHHHPISAEDAKEARPWRLPYWTEPPAWVRAKEKEEAAKAIAQDSATEVMESAEPEPALTLPTAEELENIRREAYNDGLEQGLVEGRQNGYQTGYQSGHDEGYQAAYEEGKQRGYSDGLAQGEAAGRAQAQQEINDVVAKLAQVSATLQADIVQRDAALPQVLSELVVRLCERVIGSELSQGAANILQFVQRALAELPSGEKNVRLWVSALDEPHLQQGLEQTGLEMNYRVDKALAAGECRIESDHSLVEYSTREQMNALLEDVALQLQHSAQDYPNSAEQQVLQPAKVTAPAPSDKELAPIPQAVWDSVVLDPVDEPASVEMTSAPESELESQELSHAVPSHEPESAPSLADESLAEQEGFGQQAIDTLLTEPTDTVTGESSGYEPQ